MTANMRRAIQILLSKDGTFEFARKGTQKHLHLIHDGFLPCASTDTLAQAEAIQIATCRRTYEPDSRYIYPFDETLAGLESAGEEFEQLFQDSRRAEHADRRTE